MHGGNFLHQGARRTWLLLNQIYPGHRIPLRTIAEFIESCPICQKHKQGLRDTLEPHVRVLTPTSHRHTVGIDTVTITPTSEDGYTAIITFVNHYTHFVYLYPVKTHSAREMCNAMMSYVAQFGLIDEIKSDPGSDLMSQAVADLNKWFGLRHVVSLTDVHTSNGCENTNRQVVEHLSAITSDLRLKDCWADPMLISLVQFHFNSSASREAGIIPFAAMFGSVDETYYQLDPQVPASQLQAQYLKLLDKNLKIVREISAAHQAEIASTRTAGNAYRNQFAVSDLVLKTVLTPTKHWKSEKLAVSFTGPWRVISVDANDYTVEHLVDGRTDTFHVDMLKPFFGTEQAGVDAAMLDDNQHVVTSVSHYVGDPSARKTCEFFLYYEDGDAQWTVWKEDLMSCEPFKRFCTERPELWEFLHTKEAARRLSVAANKQPIDSLSEGDTIYVDLRALGPQWYNYDISIPNEDTSVYVVPCTVQRFLNTRHTRVRVVCPLLTIYFDWNPTLVLSWAQYKELKPFHTLVAAAFQEENPSIGKSLKQARVAYHDMLDLVIATKAHSVVKKASSKRKLPAAKSNAAAPTKSVKFAEPTLRRSARLPGGKG